MYPLNGNNNTMSSQPSSAGFAQPQNTMMQGSAQQNSQYPAPSQGLTMPNAYAHGGRTKRGKLVMAHFSPGELDVMDHLQGKIEKCPRSGMRSYTHLEEVLKNPHILSSVHHHTRKHHATGGAVNDELNQIASHGVHGDTELALIGPHTHHVLSSLAQPGTITNHQDGRPQYWSLGNTLGGLWDTIKGHAAQAAPYVGAVGKAFLPAIRDAATNAVTNRFGPGAGALVNGLGGLADRGLGALQGMGSEQDRARANTLGEGLQSAMGARASGASPMQSFGAGLGQVGSRFGGALGGGMQGMGQSMQSGAGYRDMAKNTALGAYNGGGGSQGVVNAAQNAYSDFSAGRKPAQIAGNAAMNAYNSLRKSQPTLSSMQNQDAFQELPFAQQYV